MHPRIYVGRIPMEKRGEIKELFKKFGKIVDILNKDDFAFLEFETTEKA